MEIVSAVQTNAIQMRLPPSKVHVAGVQVILSLMSKGMHVLQKNLNVVREKYFQNQQNNALNAKTIREGRISIHIAMLIHVTQTRLLRSKGHVILAMEVHNLM